MSEEINKLKEITILIIDVIKEGFVLFVAILVTLNYYIRIENDEKGECDPPNNTTNSSQKKEDNLQEKPAFKGPWDALKDITEENLKYVTDVLKYCMPYSGLFFTFLIGLMYYFFYVIKTPKMLSINQTFDINVKFIFQDLWNKLTFILLFPTLFLSTISLSYISFKIMFGLPTIAPKYGFIMASTTKLFMFILFFMLFYTMGQTLYYLLTRGNISNLNEVTPFDFLLYSLSFFLIMLLIFVGFSKFLIFNLRTTFMPDVTELKKKIFSKEILPFAFITILILFITLLINIKHLFFFELWIFSVIIAIILVVLLFASFFFGESFSLGSF